MARNLYSTVRCRRHNPRPHLRGPGAWLPASRPGSCRPGPQNVPAHAPPGRPSGRTQPAVRWSSPCGRVRAVLWARVFSLGNRQDHHVWYKKELKTRALSMATHKSMHQLVRQPDCGHSANLWLFVRFFCPGPSRKKGETIWALILPLGSKRSSYLPPFSAITSMRPQCAGLVEIVKNQLLIMHALCFYLIKGAAVA